MAQVALIVGINYYPHGKKLYGCVNDAMNVEKVLAHHDDREDPKDATRNFECITLYAEDADSEVSKSDLWDEIEKLFTTVNLETALFYFSGHGHITSTGGFILTSEAKRGDEGVDLNRLIALVSKSPATNKIIILDSCHSGIVGTIPTSNDEAKLASGLTILAASTESQYAKEKDGSGIFTSLMIAALNGAGANLVGEISPASVYAHIDQSLLRSEQRPVFKTNVKEFVSLRKIKPAIELRDLRRITEFFPTPEFRFPLDATYERELTGRPEGMPLPIEENCKKFDILQKYNRLNLLVPFGCIKPNMWHAAMADDQKGGCRLTALGEHYRRLVEKGLI